MGQLRDRMEQDLILRGLAPTTRRNYLLYCRKFAAHYRRDPSELGEAEIRAFLLHTIQVPADSGGVEVPVYSDAGARVGSSASAVPKVPSAGVTASPAERSVAGLVCRFEESQVPGAVHDVLLGRIADLLCIDPKHNYAVHKTQRVWVKGNVSSGAHHGGGLNRDTLAVAADHVVPILIDRSGHLAIGDQCCIEFADSTAQMAELRWRNAPVQFSLKPTHCLAERLNDLHLCQCHSCFSIGLL